MRYTITSKAEQIYTKTISPLSFGTEGFPLYAGKKQRAEILFQKILVITVEICYNKDIL